MSSLNSEVGGGGVWARVAALETGPFLAQGAEEEIDINVEKGSRLHGLGTAALEGLVLRGLFWGPEGSNSAEVLVRRNGLGQVYKGLRLVAIHEGKWRGVCAASG
jgi:hypothetical protein